MSARYAVLVEVANLSEAERDALNSMIGMLTDPGLNGLRRRFVRGEVGLCLEDGDVTWPTMPLREAMEVAA